MKKTKNQQMKNAYIHYMNVATSTLNDVYTSYSSNKQKAYDYCTELYQRYNGERFRIISANTFAFSVGFVGTIDGKKAFFYITKSNDRYMLLD